MIFDYQFIMVIGDFVQVQILEGESESWKFHSFTWEEKPLRDTGK